MAIKEMFVVLVTVLIAFSQANETCWNRFEYEYNVIQKIVALEHERAEMNSTIAQLTTTIAWLLRTSTENTRAVGILNVTASTLVNNYAPSGTSYIRWGRTSCPTDAGAELVYDGYAAGGHYSHAGGSTKYLCLPRDPDFLSVSGGSRGQIYGAEYETKSTGQSELHDHDVPCVVCRTPRVNTIMIPGRNHCHNGWIKEYNGYLMGEYYGHTGPKENVCVDKDAETIDAGVTNHNGALFYLIQAKCGSLKCPPYEDARDLTCVVCSYSGTP